MPPVPAPLSVDVRLIVVIVPVLALTPPLIVICPLPLPSAVVITSNVLPLPAVEVPRVKEPVLLRNTLPVVLAVTLPAVRRMRATADPIFPVPAPAAPSSRETVVATSCPDVSAIPPVPVVSVEFKLMVEMVPEAAATPPLIVILPLPALAVVTRSNV